MNVYWCNWLDNVDDFYEKYNRVYTTMLSPSRKME